MEELLQAFKDNSFIMKNETTKGIEFESLHTNEIVYLLPYKEITVALNPVTVENSFLLKKTAKGLTHSTALKRYPKRINTGETPIPFGYSYKFHSIEELSSFLREFNLLAVE
ncbi:hypothetical protein LCM10_04710 [Rossellomorea aquimaris]|uniref:hypothetical protein n=1 Tax=Rossellomorea aquimaris TaxID=189382 RepID=UPI001CD21DDF|nr:hypothetical protein [Rossellomorea aquimaris]MCA1054280.1 hypothetical protein [Rossellomorea aquimaris]